MSASPQRTPVPDLEAEQEVDFGRYWRMIAARWWLPVGLLVAGLVIGYLVSLGTNSTTYKATAQVYLGQPLAPGGAAPVGSAPTSLGLVSNFVTSETTIRAVAKRVGLKPGRLRGHVTTKPITGITGAKLGTPAPLLAVTVMIAVPVQSVTGVIVTVRFELLPPKTMFWSGTSVWLDECAVTVRASCYSELFISDALQLMIRRMKDYLINTLTAFVKLLQHRPLPISDLCQFIHLL